MQSTIIQPVIMLSLVAEAWLRLLRFDLAVRSGFGRVHRIVRETRTRTSAGRTASDVDTAHILRALDHACVWYFKRCLCLQRSSVAAIMLRKRGVKAEVVIGYRPAPMDSHAWVEVDGAVVNDRPQYQKFYWVLDRL